MQSSVTGFARIYSSCRIGRFPDRSYSLSRNLCVVLSVSFFSFCLAAVASAQGTPVFINEIHYDNESTDTNEFVEVAGPAGTDLLDWSIVLYNGGNGEVYATENLSGTIPDAGNGFGMVSVSHTGIQNGAPDGIALVDADDTVVQFLSYEGSFTALNGPASDTSSVDIGVAESSSTPTGHSLQLTGSGMVYEDFAWTDPVSATPGNPNTGQSFQHPPVADAGPDQTAVAGETVCFDGSGSSDPDNDSLTFHWTLTAQPADSSATLDAPTAEKPCITTDLPGTYQVSLVVNDGTDDSPADTAQAVVRIANQVPVADAGPDQTAVAGETVCFDGSNSTDPDNDELTYTWDLTAWPAGSAAELDDPTAEISCIIADLPGTYQVSLIVNDGTEDSEPDTAQAEVEINVLSDHDAAIQVLEEALAVPETCGNYKNVRRIIERALQLTQTAKENLEAGKEESGRKKYDRARRKLLEKLVPKIDDCAVSGTPDESDWICDCDGQDAVYPLIMEAVAYLENL
ncbi:MAG: PKD domain-containing protein [Candidatus Electrothrix sp. YB6]